MLKLTWNKNIFILVFIRFEHTINFNCLCIFEMFLNIIDRQTKRKFNKKIFFNKFFL